VQALYEKERVQVVDFHTHIFFPELIAEREAYGQRDRWFGALYDSPKARMADAEDLLASMAQAGVGRSVAFGFAFADSGLCRACNAYVLQAARQYPEAIAPFAVINPRHGKEALREARDCLEAGALGIGELMPDGQGYTLTDFGCLDPLMALVRSHGAPVMFHVNEQVGHDYQGKGTQGPRQAYELAVRYPDNVIVLSHWGAGLPFYELMPEVRQALRNVYYDTAASIYLYEDAVFGHVMAWAPTKVLWATDYPLVTQERCLKRLRRAGLSAEALERVLSANAAALLP